MLFNLGLYIFCTLFVLSGLNHFRKPKFYVVMMPPYLPQHIFLIYLSGFFEVVLGAMLIPQNTRALASVGICLMLFVFLAVHFYMYQERKTRFQKIPSWILIARIPMQFLLMAWALYYLNVSN